LYAIESIPAHPFYVLRKCSRECPIIDMPCDRFQFHTFGSVLILIFAIKTSFVF